MIVTAIFAFLVTTGSGAYQSSVEKARVSKAIADIGIISLKIAQFEARNDRLPNTLAEVGLDPRMLIDPYGNQYQYLNLGALNGVGGARKDHSNVQLNRDYDLYSFGRDGVTNQTFTSSQSQDDIVRALFGSYFGTVSDYPQTAGQG